MKQKISILRNICYLLQKISISLLIFPFKNVSCLKVKTSEKEECVCIAEYTVPYFTVWTAGL